MPPAKIYETKDVFGISTGILSPSYVDRGDLDIRLTRLLRRNMHIALRGESKCGKSWLRQKVVPDAITVQCRLNKKVQDLYADALSQLGLQLVTEQSAASGYAGRLEAIEEIGVPILAKLTLKQTGDFKRDATTKSIPVGRNLNDLRFVADIIKASGRRLVIEDFHYLEPIERKSFAYDLKALWDYETYVVIIGIWAENNLLLHLNPDLSGRIEEVSIYWSSVDLNKVLGNGSKALNLDFSSRIRDRLIEDANGTVGIMQKMVLDYLDENGVFETCDEERILDSEAKYDNVAMDYAEQLNALYQTFATRVTRGIRRRQNSTGIYGHMLRVILDADIDQLNRGLSLDDIFVVAHAKEPRIQKGNLRLVLTRLDGLQVDEQGRGLILTFDEPKGEVFVVDKQLFLYRKYATAQWPWERIIEQADESGTGYEAEVEDGVSHPDAAT
jgi:hypothetical protein